MAQINMNGRIHDPLIGRFMSADAYIQAPDDLQSHNRYAYVMNNPLNLTDPTGFFSWRQEWRNAKRKIVRVAALALDYYCGGCGTLLLVAWDGYWMKDAKGQKLGWKGAAFGAGMAYIGQQTGGNQWYTAGVNAITACGMGHMSGGSCKAGLHESLGNSAGTLLLGNNLAGAALGGCLGARAIGNGCAAGARAGARSYATSHYENQIAGGIIGWNEDRKAAEAAAAEAAKQEGVVELAQVSKAIGGGTRASGYLYPPPDTVDDCGGCSRGGGGGYTRAPSIDIPRITLPSFDWTVLLPFPIRVVWNNVLSVNGADQPRESDLVIVPENQGNRVAGEHGYKDAHDAKKGRGESSVNIYDDKKTGRKWLWNGRKGSGKEEL